MSKITTNGYPIANIDPASKQDALKVRDLVLQHGVVVLKGLDLDEYQFQKLIANISTEGQNFQIPNVARLIPAFDQSTNVPGIIKITNIDKNDNVIPGHHAAEYWHSDGDFWPGHKKNLWNFMHMKVIPAVGGGTGFLDGQLALDLLKKSDGQFYQTLRKICVAIDAKTIGDFDPETAAEMFPEPTTHDVVHLHPGSGKEGLYLGTHQAVLQVKKEHRNDSEFRGLDDGDLEKLMTDVKQRCMTFMERPECQYQHNWADDEVLIWDNTVGMHSSLGGYGNHRRMAIRGQCLMFQ